jgi:hypothetical protein
MDPSLARSLSHPKSLLRSFAAAMGHPPIDSAPRAVFTARVAQADFERLAVIEAARIERDHLGGLARIRQITKSRSRSQQRQQRLH